MLFEPACAARYHLHTSSEGLHVVAVCHHGIGELNGHIGTTESLGAKVVLVVYIDDADNLMSALKGNLLNHLAHFPITYKCYFHNSTYLKCKGKEIFDYLCPK